jgi:hypothetical protein
LSLGCAHATARSRAAPDAAFGWQTLSAVHRVHVRSRDREGRPVERTIRGLFVAARQPDRFRVRALGPGDVTLFDLAYEGGGGCRVLEAARTPPPELSRALCDDLAVAYRLGPLRASTAQIEYGDWRSIAGRPTPFSITIRDPSAGYEAEIRVVDVTLDAGWPQAP